MNDVLPKPFTKEGLLNMLEKHLGHLKKMPEVMDAMPPATAPSMAQSSTTHSLKEESSPGQSPSTLNTTWQSPGQFPGISPTVAASPTQYIQPTHASTGYGMDHAGMQFPSPQTPLGPPLPRPGQGQHRRQVSEISGGGEDIANDPKRQRIYAHPIQR